MEQTGFILELNEDYPEGNPAPFLKPSSSKPRVSPSRGYRKLSRTIRKETKGNESIQHESVFSQRKLSETKPYIPQRGEIIT